METLELIKTILRPVALILAITVLITFGKGIYQLIRQRLADRRRLKLFLAVELLMESDSTEDINEFCDIGLDEATIKLNDIADKNYTNKAIKKALKDSEFYYLELYFDIVVRDKLCSKRIEETGAEMN